jgi:hypothetical protein
MNIMTNGSNLTLSAYDQSLGVGTPSLYRLFCLKQMPDVERLVFSLGKTLERFPRFATRIALADDGRSKLIPLEEPLAVELRPAASWTPEAFRLEQVPHFVRGLTTEAGEPVLAVTLTPVTSGAVLGVSCSHAVADMYSYYLFHAYWNEQIRSTAHLEQDRGQRFARLLDLSDATTEKWGEEDFAGGNDESRNEIQDYLVVGFDHGELEELRSELKKDDILPSLNEAITAYMVHRFMCKLVDPASTIRLRVPISLRGMHPLLSKDYIGNAIIEALVPVSDLTDTPAAACATAHRIRESVRAARSHPNFEENINVDENGISYKGADNYAYDRRSDLLCTNTSKMAFHQIDFGCNAPAKVLGLTYNGLRIAATENGLEAHVRWDRSQRPAQFVQSV